MSASREYEVAFQLIAELDASVRRNFDQVTRQIEELQRQLGELTEGDPVKKLGDDAKKAGGAFGKLGAGIKGFGGVLSRTAQYMGAFAILDTVTGAFGNITGTLDDYQKTMNQIAASTNITAAELEDVKGITKDLYAQNLGESFDDVGRAIATVKQVTKQSGDELKNTARNAIALRDVFDFDINESIKATDTMVKNFGITSQQAYNLLAQGAKSGLDKSGELIDTANEYSVYFKSLGFSANEMFDIFAAGLEGGAFNLDKVGDAIKELGIRTKDGSKGTLEAYKQIGLSGSKMTKEFAKGGPAARKAFEQVTAAIEKVKDPATRNAASVALFGTQFEDLEKNAITALTHARKQFDMTKKTMDGILKVKYSSFGEAIQGIGRNILTELVMPIGDLLLPSLQNVANWFADNIKNIKGFFKGTGTVIKNAAQMIGGIVIDGPSIQTTDKGMNILKTLGFDDKTSINIMVEVNKVLDSMSGSLKAISKPLKDIMPNFKQLKQGAKDLGDKLRPLIESTFKNFGTQLGQIQKTMGPVIAYFTSKVAPVFKEVFATVGDTIIPRLIEAFKTIQPAITSAFGKALTFIAAFYERFKPLLDFIVAAVQWAFPLIKYIIGGAIDNVATVIKGLLGALGGILDFLTGVFTGDWELAWQGIVNTFGSIWGTLKGLVAKPLNAVIDLANQAIAKINSISFDLPDKLGGGHFGMNIPQIPRLEGYADGGITNKPAIFGEAGPEAAIPLNNKPRSRALLESTNRLMGYNPNSGGGSFHYNPVFQIQGNADENAIQQMNEQNTATFRSMFEQYKREQGRVSFANG